MFPAIIQFITIFYVHELSAASVKRETAYEPKVFSSCFEDMGCIDFNEKWFHEKYRPTNLDPLDRHTIRTEFLLMKNQKSPAGELMYDIMSLKKESVEVAGFKKGTCSIFIIHDFTSNGYTGWIKHLVIAFSQKTDCNIISIDWQAGAEPPFEQAMSNARVVALEAKLFITLLKTCFDQSADTLHLIGHGVGAHIAGYIGKYIQCVQRITGLDPTGPFFEHMPKEVRLDADDAKYVEILHTDSFNHRSQGSKAAHGHANFIINNAGHQPGCNDSSHLPAFTDLHRDSLQEGKILPDCSHKRSFKYYIQSLDEHECQFIGIRCKSHENFLNGKCNDCRGTGKCATFGLQPPSVKTRNNSYYMLTSAVKPFCMLSYAVNISISAATTNKDVEGYFEMLLVGEDNLIANATSSHTGKIRKFISGHIYKSVFYATPPRINKVKEAKVRWNYKSHKVCVLCDKTISVRDITIRRLTIKPNFEIKTSAICPIHKNMELKPGDYVEFVSCESLYGKDYLKNGHNQDPTANPKCPTTSSHHFTHAKATTYHVTKEMVALSPTPSIEENLASVSPVQTRQSVSPHKTAEGTEVATKPAEHSEVTHSPVEAPAKSGEHVEGTSKSAGEHVEATPQPVGEHIEASPRSAEFNEATAKPSGGGTAVPVRHADNNPKDEKEFEDCFDKKLITTTTIRCDINDD